MADDSYTPSDSVMNAIQQIESGGNPNAQTGSYKGLYQLSEPEFQRYGGQGSIFDPAENTRVARQKITDEANQLSQALGRPVTDAEVYLAHQQGVGGATAHLTNPDQPAWQSMAQTAEGRQKGEKWAKQAIWGNLPDSAKAQFGSVDNVKSSDFTNWWGQRYARAAGQSAPQQAPSSPFQLAVGQTATFPVSRETVSPVSAPQQLAQNSPQTPANYLPNGGGSPPLQVPQIQAMPIQYYQRRPVNLDALRAQLQTPTFPRG